MTHDYIQPDADQAERCAVLRDDAKPTTYFEMEARSAQRTDKPSVEVTGASAKPWGHDLPAPSYGADITGREPPLGIDVNAVNDSEACWWIDSAVSPREAKAQGAEAQRADGGDADAEK